LNYIKTILGEAATGNPGEIFTIVKQIEEFWSSIPNSDMECLKSGLADEQVWAVAFALDVANLTTAIALDKVLQYVSGHIPALVADFKQMNTQWDSEQFSEVG